MNKYFTLIIFTLLFFSSDIHSQWFRQYIDADILIEDIRFINRYTGWLCGADLIYKTTNGGENWLNQPNQVNRLIRQIHPVNDRVVYSCGFQVIMKTEDGGNNWITLREGSNLVPRLNGLWFHDENTGWFCGDVAVMRTTDGGKTFIDSMRIPEIMEDINFKDSTTGIICGSISSPGSIVRTTNAGISWYYVPLPNNTIGVPYINRESFIEDYGWLASRENIVYRTTNYGISWDSISYIYPDHSTYCIEFSSLLTGYSGGDYGKIYKTTDSGYNWFQQQTTQFDVYGFKSIYAYNDSVVWAVGGGGKILYTENGGGSLVNILHNDPQDLKYYILYQNYPNPFNPKTFITYELMNSNFIKLIIYDLKGREMKTLVNRMQNAGFHSIEFDGEDLSSGVYFYQMRSGDSYIETMSMLLLK